MEEVMGEPREKLNMGCLSVFWTGLKGFFYISLVVIAVIVLLLFGLWVFFAYMNFLLASPLWLTCLGLLAPIILFVGYYVRFLQWSFGTYIELTEKQNEENND
jgi:hypothetical protein